VKDSMFLVLCYASPLQNNYWYSRQCKQEMLNASLDCCYAGLISLTLSGEYWM